MHKDLIRIFEAQAPNELSHFFYDNAIAIDQLIQQYDAWNLENTRQQIHRIREIKKGIRQRTADHGWTDIDGLDICYQFTRPDVPSINIEAGFIVTRTQPAGEFVINVTTTGIKAWNHYEDKLLQEYTTFEPVIAMQKTVLRVATIGGDQHDKMVDTLQQVYDFLHTLCVQAQVHKVTVPGLS
ncbi:MULTISPECIES: hypothetical protein [unclassified Chitinophaga]|uniref:hypothetical protein n=1 Tax=unclassified Chitinophaga TaxID=2619133 RepID=UPI0009CE1F4A|nr:MULTISPECIES: hypothetical protein [unclassified Chitinophaga]OMP75815.1 hypothetical protein BW716_28325 [[Flexibacter] sp. ATCC 35208]WPV67882.1 hypothetical protein QQL36_03985 [Chitinophaga sp. LS1]